MIAVGQFTIYDFHDVHSSPTAPTNPVKDMVWLDTSVKPPLMRVWDGKAWVLANDFTDEIDKKADSDDVYNKNEVYTKTETDSKIKVAKDGIDLSVSKLQTTVNNHTTQINNKADLNVVDEKINEIEIGGTNLVRKGSIIKYNKNGTYTTVDDSNFYADGGAIISRTNATNEGAIIDRYVTYEDGKSYIVAFNIRTTSGTVNKIHIYNGRNHKNSSVYIDGIYKGSMGKDLPFPEDTNYHRIEIRFEAVATDESIANEQDTRHIIPQPMKSEASAYTVQIQYLNIQKGNKILDWSPSPKDVQDAINNKANTSDVYNKEQINDSLQGLIDQTKNLQDEYSNLVDDKKITPNEKIQLKSELAQIQSKTEAMEGIVDALKDSTLSTYMNTLKQKKADVEAKLNPILANMTITSDVSETDVHAAINAFYEAYEVALKLAQMSMNATLTETKTQLSVVADGMNVAINKSQEALDMKYKVGKHFNFTDQGWVEIFASINGQQGRFKTQITDQQLAFTDSGNVVAYLSNQELFITMARIVNALQIGNIGLETSGDKGGIIFKWRD